MKKYTVKQVTKMQERLRNMESTQAINHDDDMIYPALLSFAVGGSLLPLALEAAPDALIITILTGVVTLYGLGESVRILFREQISDNLYNRLKKAYSSMGPEFEAQVNEELRKREIERKQKALQSRF